MTSGVEKQMILHCESTLMILLYIPCLFCGKTNLLTKKITSRLIHMKIITSHKRGLLRLLLCVSTHRPALLNAFTTGLADPNRQKHTLNMAWKRWVCRRYFLRKKSSRREARVEAGRSGRGQQEKLNKRGRETWE